MAIKIPEIEIDGAIAEVYDSDAIHKDELVSYLEQASIREVIGNLFFPVGSVYITSSETNPATLFGGEWEPVEGRVIMGADANHLVNSVGGSEDAVVVSHNHHVDFASDQAGLHEHNVSGKTNETGSHSHIMGDFWSNGNGMETAYTMTGKRVRIRRITAAAGSHYHTLVGSIAQANGRHTHAITGDTVATGVDGTGKNNMPYVAYYIWRRTA